MVEKKDRIYPYHIPCHMCGKDLPRVIKVQNPICYTCKQKEASIRNKLYAQKKKLDMKSE